MSGGETKQGSGKNGENSAETRTLGWAICMVVLAVFGLVLPPVSAWAPGLDRIPLEQGTLMVLSIVWLLATAWGCVICEKPTGHENTVRLLALIGVICCVLMTLVHQPAAGNLQTGLLTLVGGLAGYVARGRQQNGSKDSGS